MNTIALIILSIVIIAFCAIMIITLREIRHLSEMTNHLVDDVTDNNDDLEEKLKNMHQLNEVLANILIDLAEADDSDVIQWKLFTIRRVKDLLESKAHYVSIDIYNLILKSLDMKKDENTELLAQVKYICKDYFVMERRTNYRLLRSIEDMLRPFCGTKKERDVLDYADPMDDVADSIYPQIKVVREIPRNHKHFRRFIDVAKVCDSIIREKDMDNQGVLADASYDDDLVDDDDEIDEKAKPDTKEVSNDADDKSDVYMTKDEVPIMVYGTDKT